LSLVRSNSGGVAAFTAIMLAVLISFIDLSVDIGYLPLVESELQRAADAGVLAGAMGLVPYTGTSNNPTPDWLQGQAKARDLVNDAANKAGGQTFNISAGSVLYGYWLLNPSGQEQTLSSVRPAAAFLPQPAIRVNLSRTVDLYFAPLIGITSPTTVNATATAILPEAFSIGNIPPIAVAGDIVYDYDIINDIVVIDVNEQTVKPTGHPKDGAVWFNLSGANNVPSVRLNTPLTSPTSQIYMVPGTKATLTDFLTPGETIVIPVVQDVSKKEWQTIRGFVAFKIEQLGANQMRGRFVNKYFDPNVLPSAGSGINLGVAGTPKLVGP